MKKLMTLRQRGYDLLQISLGIAVVLGLMVGGLLLFNQVQTSSELTDKTRTAVAVSSEVRAQYRTAADYSTLTADAGAEGLVSESQFATRSGMPDAMFANLDITGNGQTFDLVFSSLNETVCSRMGIANLGPNGTPDDTDCENGNLTVTYSR
ncbi:hypothetical protein KUV57_13080 [Epibacterium sp. DP7N7-1]|nr:hypothetical protein [Epibacterium sp. DP7N7-1]